MTKNVNSIAIYIYTYQVAKQGMNYLDVLELTELQIAAKRLNLSIPASSMVHYPFSAEVFDDNGEQLGWMMLSIITGLSLSAEAS
jgi:hypothetical protein